MAVYDDEKEKLGLNTGQHDDLGVSPKHRKVEAALLDGAYDRPGYKYAPVDNNTSPDQLGEEEKLASASQPTKPERAETDSLLSGDGFYEDGGKSPSRGVTHRVLGISQKRLAVGAGGLLVGVLFALFTLMAGPLQFIHAAQLLQHFHFAGPNSFIEDRTAKLYRYHRWNDKPQNRRLSLVGNFLADKIDAKFSRSGMSLEFDTDGTMRKIRLDKTKFPANELTKMRGEFEVRDIDGKFAEVILPNKFSGKQSRALYDRTRKAFGMAGFGGYIQSRLSASRISPSMFHPITKADELTRDKVRERWRARKQAIIKNDASLSVSGSPDQKDENGNTKPNSSDDAAGAVSDVTNIDPSLEGKARIDEIKANIGKGLIGVGAVDTVTGLVCLVYGLAGVANEAEYQNIVGPSMATGGYQMGLGEQIESGQDFSETQLGFEAEHMFDESEDNDPATKPSSFFDAQSIKTNLGETGGIETPSSLRLGGSDNFLTKLENTVPEDARSWINTGCKIVENPAVEIIIFGADLFLAPVSAASGLAKSLLLGVFLDDLARFAAGSAIDTDLSGAALGAVADQGAFFLANQQFITLAGTPVSNQERTELKTALESERQHHASELTWVERYLSPSNAFSVVGSIARKQPVEANKLVANLLNVPKTIASSSKLFGAKVSAQQVKPFDYGSSMIAYRPSELARGNDDETLANPYLNAAAINDMIPTMHAKYGEKCFGLKFDEQEHFTITQVVNQKSLAEHPDWADCRRTDEEFLRYRYYVADLMVFVTNACYEGDETACKEIGFADQVITSNSPVSGGGTKGQDTSTQNCTIGQDAGLGDTPDPNIKIRLCKIENTTVNVSMEQNLKAVLDGGKAAGLTYGGGSYRSHQSQINLRRQNCGTSQYAIYQMPSSQCSPPTARPGNSMHEWGLAVDFHCNSSLITSRSSRCFTWLEENQGAHQLTNLPSEAWHWSTTGN